ncbi:MAG: agmatinase [Thermoanaerobaculia bacterium]
MPTNFGLLPPELSDPKRSPVMILPVPFERTTSYGKGTSAGPGAFLRASQSMELYDEELGGEPCDIGIATAQPFHPEAFDMEEAMAELEVECQHWMDAGKFLVTVGGEHSLSIAPVRAAQRVFGGGRGGEIGIVQFDAHSDLREEFEGTAYSHASVMRRVFDEGVRSLSVGIRSLSAPEAELIRRHKLPVIWGHELEPAATLEKRFAAMLRKLPKKIYLTFDIDFFDPSIVPATGTPEPGGGTWHPTLRLLRHLFEEKEVVAMDLVELAPIGGQPASDFVAAKLAYKCIGYKYAKRRGAKSKKR